MDNKRIAVVILNWNGAEMMRRFLPSVVRYSEHVAEVVVADNGSTDNSREVVRTEFPSVTLLELPQNYGFAEGYNRALALVDAEFFVLLNSDVEVTGGWLEPQLAYLDSHPEVAACQPKLLAWKDKGSFEYAGASGGYLDEYGYPFCRGRIFDCVEKDKGQYDDVAEVLWASGAALMVRSKDWKEAGGLDGRFFAHMEEIDFCWRLSCRGRSVVCVPAAKVYHVGGASLAQGNPRKTFLNFRNNLLMLYKNLPDRQLAKVMRVRLVLDYVAALKFLLGGDVPSAKAVVRARREYKKIKKNFLKQREENISRMTVENPYGKFDFSLLGLHYIKGVKRFSDIPSKYLKA